MLVTYAVTVDIYTNEGVCLCVCYIINSASSRVRNSQSTPEAPPGVSNRLKELHLVYLRGAGTVLAEYFRGLAPGRCRCRAQENTNAQQLKDSAT